VNKSKVFFDRRELNLLLQMYGRGVALGEWRDYAMDGLEDRALFSIYRRASEAPLYQVEKNPALARKQGAFSARNAAGFILRRGHELERVIAVLEPRALRVVDD
jgi:hypothetical protein